MRDYILNKVFVNNQMIYVCYIDFTTSPCDISNITTYYYETTTEPETTTTFVPDYPVMPDNGSSDVYGQY